MALDGGRETHFDDYLANQSEYKRLNQHLYECSGMRTSLLNFHRYQMTVWKGGAKSFVDPVLSKT